MKHPARRLPRRNTKGVALIEALIGILIFCVGVLGLVGLQASMTGAQTAAKSRADAAFLTSEVIGSMWIDRPNLAKYATSPASPCTYQRCLDWVNKVGSGLPNGKAEAAVDVSSGNIGLTVTWVANSEGTRTYVLSTSIQ